MIAAEEALQIVLRVAQRLTPVSVPLHEALGKVLAEEITAPDPLPPYPASIKVSLPKTLLPPIYYHTHICISSSHLLPSIGPPIHSLQIVLLFLVYFLFVLGFNIGLDLVIADHVGIVFRYCEL